VTFNIFLSSYQQALLNQSHHDGSEMRFQWHFKPASKKMIQLDLVHLTPALNTINVLPLFVQNSIKVTIYSRLTLLI
jgi:hypothetical protein